MKDRIYKGCLFNTQENKIIQITNFLLSDEISSHVDADIFELNDNNKLVKIDEIFNLGIDKIHPLEIKSEYLEHLGFQRLSKMSDDLAYKDRYMINMKSPNILQINGINSGSINVSSMDEIQSFISNDMNNQF